jgi:hypothetical protein
MILRQSYRLSDEVEPESAYLDSLRARKDLEAYDFEKQLPVFSHPSVLKELGQKGSPFNLFFKLHFFWEPAARRLLGTVWFPNHCEGPYGFVHGGAIAAAIDTAMGLFTIRAV